MKALILSDIHANLPALEAIQEAEPDYDACLFLGDVVDYGPFPTECIAFLKNEMDVGVLGNHDNALAFATDCGCRADFRLFAEETRVWHRSLLDDADVRFLRSLPPVASTHVDGLTVYLAHATPQGDLSRYLSDDEVDAAVRPVPAALVLLGHTHVQFSRYVGHTQVVNPGSVGFARDGTLACYAILLDGKVHLRRIPYDVERTIREIQRGPLSERSKEGLERVLRGSPRP